MRVRNFCAPSAGLKFGATAGRRAASRKAELPINPMKNIRQILLAALAGVILVPAAVFAAKGDGKKGGARPDFATLDKDGDGVVTEVEFLAGAKGEGTEAQSKKRFATLDADHDGKLTKEEMSARRSGEKKKRKESK